MSTDLEIRNVVVVQGRGGVGWAGQEMGIPNLGCSQLVGQGGQATLPQWGYCSSAWSKTDTELGSQQRRVSNHGWPLSSSSSSLSGFCYSHQEPSPVLGTAL